MEPSLAASSDAFLTADGLRHDYHGSTETVRALDDVGLTADLGELVAVVGSSGSGKTTLLSILAGLLRPSAGDVRLDGQSLLTLGDKRLARLRLERIGLAFQTPCLMAAMNAADNVRVPLHLSGSAKDARGRALAELERVGLGSRARHFPRELSRGELQRVAIARALVKQPDLLLADEPTGNLDREARRLILKRLRDYATEDGRTVIIATHDNELAAAADRNVRLVFGRRV